MKANLVEEGFYLSQPKHATQKALGSGRSVPLFEAGGTYQLLDHYTVVIKKLKSTHEKVSIEKGDHPRCCMLTSTTSLILKVVDVVAMKQFALRKKDKKVCQRAKDLLMQAPDILADTLGKPQARRSMENLQSGKRSYSALTEVDVNDAASTENSNRSLESSRGSDFASEVESISKKLSEIVDSSRCRASGLSKKARRST